MNGEGFKIASDLEVIRSGNRVILSDPRPIAPGKNVRWGEQFNNHDVTNVLLFEILKELRAQNRPKYTGPL